MLVLALPTCSYALFAGDWSGRHAFAQSVTVIGIALLTVLAVGLVRRLFTQQVNGLVLLFDGRAWFSDRGDQASVISVYSAAGLLAARVEVAGQRYRLLLCSAHYSREGWRRLRLGLGLALGEGAGGR